MYRTKEKYSNMALFTEKKWQQKGYAVKEGESPLLLYPNKYTNKKVGYYNESQVREMTEDETENYRQIIRERNRKSREKKLTEIKNECMNQAREERKEKEKHLAACLIDLSNKLPSVPCDNPSKTIVVDTETTGLTADSEILQVSIIDGDGNTLFNSFVKPYIAESWSESECIHHISPDMVKDAPYPHEIIPIIKGIYESAYTYIGYNSEFDMGKLHEWGLNFDGEVIDVMKDFAPYYGEYSEYFKDYKYQKLTTCANVFGYHFKPHDSLEDVKATLHCHKCLQKALAEKV